MATVEQATQTNPKIGDRVTWTTLPHLTATISHVQKLRGDDWLVGLSYEHKDQRAHGVRPHYDVYWSECRAVQG